MEIIVNTGKIIDKILTKQECILVDLNQSQWYILCNTSKLVNNKSLDVKRNKSSKPCIINCCELIILNYFSN